MKRPRVPIAGLMAAVAAVAINLALIRWSFEQTTAVGLSHLFFACGAMPMASLLILVALTSVPSLVRGGRLSPFVLGFEAMGSLAVFAFMTCYSLVPSILLGYSELFGAYTRPVFTRYFPDPSRWVAIALELGFGTVIFSLPQCLVALLGGWVNRKLGFTIRFERRVTEPAAGLSGVTSDVSGPRPSGVEWQVSH